jgi:hypothetical protein
MMENLKEQEIARSYEGKHYISEKLRKIAVGSGNTRAIITNRRITKSQGALIGITDEIFNKWWDDGICFGVFIDLDEASESIVRCGIFKDREEHKEDGSIRFVITGATEQELEIFQNVMEFVTKEQGAEK